MIDPSASPRTRGVLVSDFDGTMTRRDFYQVFRERYLPDDAPDFWTQYRAGQLTHFEALRDIFASASPGEAALLSITDEMGLDPALGESLERLRSAGWEVVVVSAGCEWYIRHLLKRANVHVECHANRGRVENGRLIMELPTGSPYFSSETGIDKAGAVRRVIERGLTAAFAGDGYPDLEAALLVPEDLRFARGDLASALRSRMASFRDFDRWADVAEAISNEKSGA